MPRPIKADVEYFFNEGISNLEDCLRVAFEAALGHGVDKIVIFTGLGKGPRLAVENFLSRDIYRHIRVVAVTFPQGKEFLDEDRNTFTQEISSTEVDFMRLNGVALVRAHLPFDPISAHFRNHGILGQDLTLIGNALSIFCGSMSLCVQATLMACDAGEVILGEHVIALTSDTAILVRAASTARLLTDFIVREILCKPLFLNIGKAERQLTDKEAPGRVSVPSPNQPIQRLP
jgi:hypothetical protein